MVVAGDRRVEGDDPQTVNVDHTILRGDAVRAVTGVLWLVEQLPCVGRPLVVVAHAPHDLGAEACGDRLDEAAEPSVRRSLPEVHEIARDHDRVRLNAGVLEPLEGRDEPNRRVDSPVELDTAVEQVGVGKVNDGVRGRRVLPELDHAPKANRPPVPSRRRPAR